MSSRTSISVEDSRRQLVQRLASSSYLSKSARLREMFLYLCGRVIDQSVDDIHEQEVGHKVFGRPADYDTSVDNIVRVHASMLRKRIEQYFATEGHRETVVIDIPRGNYAPVFKKRPSPPPSVPPADSANADGTTPATASGPKAPSSQSGFNWKIWLPTALAVLFACLAVFFAVRSHQAPKPSVVALAKQPNVRQFWSQIFPTGRTTDLVLDDASLGFFQEISGRNISLTEYFDRSYLQSIKTNAGGLKLDPAVLDAWILKRQSSYADVVLLERLSATAAAVQGSTKTRFARDYTFRELKADNVILLGKIRSNPWIEPFESRLGLHWNFDTSARAYYPVDTAVTPVDAQKYHMSKEFGKPYEGYASISYLPNLSGNGKVLIVSATGGSAVSAALDFLSDENSMTQLRSKLQAGGNSDLPYFETLLKVESRSTLPRDTAMVVCRRLK